MIVDRTTVAQIFGVSPDTARAWVKAGCPSLDPEDPTGSADQRRRKFDTVAVHQWLLQRAMRGYW
jgi:phage terminase Nu1 subunit (DNA packaging protein)